MSARIVRGWRGLRNNIYIGKSNISELFSKMKELGNKSENFGENKRGSRQYMYVSKCVKGSVKFAAESREKSEKEMLKNRKMSRARGHDGGINPCYLARLARLRDRN